MLSDILGYLKKNNTATADEISKALGIEKSLVESGLYELVRKKRVEQQTVSPLSCAGCNGCTTSSCFKIEVFSLIK